MTVLRRTFAGRIVAWLGAGILAGAFVATFSALDAGAQTPADRVLRADCTACHARAHDLVLGKGEAASQRCTSCHDKAHEEFRKIEAFYAGTSGGIKPDPMFTARVDCADCHVDTTLALKGTARTAALDRVCTNCHGTRFAGMLSRWSAGMEWRTRVVTQYLATARGDAQVTASAGARARLADAREILASLAAEGALHNVRGADALLRDALGSAAAAYRSAGVPAPDRPSLGPNPANVSCVSCHYGIEAARGSAFGKSFDHASHVIRADVACTKCHTDADFLVPDKSDVDLRKRQLDPRHGKTTLNAASCNNCHHSPTSNVSCVTCHRSDALAKVIRVTMPLRLTPKNAPRSRIVDFQHSDHLRTECASCHTSRENLRNVAQCSSCHENHHRETTAKCATCHATDARAQHKQQDHFACTSCHAASTVAMLTPNRAFCVNCHVKQVAHKPDRECSTCHMQSTPAEVRKRIVGGAR